MARHNMQTACFYLIFTIVFYYKLVYDLGCY